MLLKRFTYGQLILTLSILIQVEGTMQGQSQLNVHNIFNILYYFMYSLS